MVIRFAVVPRSSRIGKVKRTQAFAEAVVLIAEETFLPPLFRMMETVTASARGTVTAMVI